MSTPRRSKNTGFGGINTTMFELDLSTPMLALHLDRKVGHKWSPKVEMISYGNCNI